MKVLFAPDWRNGVPYQRLLAEALAGQGVEVEFLSHYRRGLPLARMLREHRVDLLHLHWPEAYYPQMHDRWDWFRRARFRTDLALATQRTPLAVTAHNLQEHNFQHLPFARANYAAAYGRARVIFAHSAAARDQLVATYQVDPRKICVIPHGDLSVVLPPPIPQAEARAQLRLPDGPLCLIFGVVEPYKGQEEVLARWKAARPDCHLAIVGKPHTDEYRQTIERLASDLPNVTLRLTRQSDTELSQHLSAADCSIFNYRTIFTSGAATLARSWGLPLLIPQRLDTVELAEPDPRVIRFDRLDESFAAKLTLALETKPDYEAAAPWRELISWPRIATQTTAAYRGML